MLLLLLVPMARVRHAQTEFQKLYNFGRLKPQVFESYVSGVLLVLLVKKLLTQFRLIRFFGVGFIYGNWR